MEKYYLAHIQQSNVINIISDNAHGNLISVSFSKTTLHEIPFIFKATKAYNFLLQCIAMVQRLVHKIIPESLMILFCTYL